MGCYDEYGDEKNHVQLKNGPCEMNWYKVGDVAPLDDGIYVGYEGFVIIHDKEVLRVDAKITDKWGNSIPPEICLLNSPVQKVVDETVKKYKKD